MKYNNFAALDGKTLAINDEVVIGKRTYNVASCYLNSDKGNNNAPFMELGMSDENQHNAIASLCYGYKDDGGYWPQSRRNDFEALTRLTLVLMLFHEGAQAVEVKVGSKWVHIDRA